MRGTFRLQICRIMTLILALLIVSQPMPVLGQEIGEPEAEILGLTYTELAIVGTAAISLGVPGYGLFVLATGADSVAGVLATVVALEAASLAILAGLGLKAGAIGGALYLLPPDDQEQFEDSGAVKIPVIL